MLQFHFFSFSLNFEFSSFVTFWVFELSYIVHCRRWVTLYIIDNIVTAINCGNTSKLLNDKVNKFTNQKKLKLSDKKCANIQIEEKKLQKLNVLKRILVTEFQGHSCSSKSTGLWNFRRNWGNIKRYTFWKLEDSNWSPVEEGLVFK